MDILVTIGIKTSDSMEPAVVADTAAGMTVVAAVILNSVIVSSASAGTVDAVVINLDYC